MVALPDAPSIVPFREAPARETGVTWVHVNGRSDKRYLPETTGAGVAIFDFDNDGWMDILLVNSGRSRFFTSASPIGHALYRNNHDGTFSEVAQKAGISSNLFGMGVASGDYDGDGFIDLFLSGFEKCLLYHNNGNGTFSDVTSESGLGPCSWGTSAVWFDYDNDGKLDLFVGEFADYSELKTCTLADSYGGAGGSAPAEQSYYCNPRILRPIPSHLYRNLGHGRFSDVSGTTGLFSKPGKAWGAVATDINGDGYLDIFVANDTAPNFLWLNRRGERFDEVGLEAGVAYGPDGQARSGMGVDAADFDGDGRSDLIVANIDTQMTSLYRNTGDEAFEDINVQTAVAAATRFMSGWGLRFFDYNNDGLLDLILSNGHPDDLVEQRTRGITYKQPLLLLRHQPDGRMLNLGPSAGPAFARKYSARGLAVGDLNNDGYPDIVFSENGGPVHVLINNAAAGNRWLGLRLRGKTANPAAIGAMIKWSIGGKIFTRLKNAGGSYLSSHDPREILGASRHSIDWVEVHWPSPSRRIDRIAHPAMNRYLDVFEGQSSGSAERTGAGGRLAKHWRPDQPTGKTALRFSVIASVSEEVDRGLSQDPKNPCVRESHRRMVCSPKSRTGITK